MFLDYYNKFYYIEIAKNHLILNFKVKPNSKKNSFAGVLTIGNKAYLKVTIKALAIDGKANIEFIKFLANFFEIPKSKIIIKKGIESTFKKIQIDIIFQEQILKKLSEITT